jgi:acetyl-CoA carboxylase carboxyltransferase component
MKPEDLQEDKYLATLLDKVSKVLMFAMEALPRKTDEDAQLKNLLDEMLKKVDDMSEVYPKDAQEFFDIANLLEKSSADAKKDPKLCED